MKVKELVEFLQTLDQEEEVLFADYYYDCREGFSEINLDYLKKCIVKASESEYYKQYGSAYLFDAGGV